MFWRKKQKQNILEPETSLPQDDRTEYQKQNDRKLYKKYGKNTPKDTMSLCLLCIADTHGLISEEEKRKIEKWKNKVDVILFLGDVDYRGLDDILLSLQEEQDTIYAIRGNHDGNYIQEHGLNPLHGQVISINGITLLGFEGTYRYKESESPMWSQEEAKEVLEQLPPCDILVTHDTPKRLKQNCSKGGLDAISEYIFRNHIFTNIHGHLHENYCIKLENGSWEIGVYGVQAVELNKEKNQTETIRFLE